MANAAPKKLKEATAVSPAAKTSGANGKQAVPGLIKFQDPGVGGDADSTFTFKIGVLLPSGVIDDSRAVRMELAPARRSTHDKSGMQPPGAGHGMEFKTRINLAKMTIPGAKPTYQQMGISEEVIEWVGAFIGMDVESGNSINYTSSKTSLRDNTSNAWDQSCDLTKILKKGQELGIQLQWNAKSRNNIQNNHSLRFSTSKNASAEYSLFKGYVKEFARSYATEQRVYYRIVFVLTNNQDIYDFIDEPANELKFAFPFASETGKNKISVAMPKSEDLLINRKKAYETQYFNGHAQEEFSELNKNLSDNEYRRRLVTALRGENGRALTVGEIEETNKALDTFQKYEKYILTPEGLEKNKEILKILPKKEIKNAQSTLAKLRENNNSSDLSTAMDGLEFVDRNSSTVNTMISLYF